MREREPTEWVVYKVGAEQQGGHHAVCSQQEWEALQKSSSAHTLIRAHIRHEGEAEQFARSLQTVPPAPKVMRPTVLALKKAAALEAARVAAMAAANTIDVLPEGEMLSPELRNPVSLEISEAIPEDSTEIPS